MSKPQSVLVLARRDAQELRKKIRENISRAEHATWSDVKDMQADVVALAARMKTLAADQAESGRSAMTAAIETMTAAVILVEDHALIAKEGIHHANRAMLDSVHKAARSLSAAIAEARHSLARCVAPSRVPA